MAETDWHRNLMMALIQTLQLFYAKQPLVYVSGNLLVFYEPGNRRKHLSPDVFVVLGVAKHDRPYFLLWEEKKGPAVVIELTSKTTKKEDLQLKFALYRDVLKVKEYFLFDPLGDYLKPRLQGYRLRKGEYVPIRFKGERLPSRILGLQLEPNGRELRLYDPKSNAWLPTPTEVAEQLTQENEQLRRALANTRRDRNGE
ncbi:MAG: Uma2 family endonuclease [Gemmataceae bacterium]|nr:Uma2 family endonuclease [Gemmataceae bacterium]MCI0738848.1 Uma2 family endonuclease [Gemmataceae bacterium]